MPMPTAPAEGEDPEAAKAAKRKKKTDTQRQKRAEEAVGRGRQPGQAGRPGGTAQPVAEGPVTTSCGESSATAGGGREAQEADGPGEFRHDLITIDREHYLMLVEMASRSLPKDLAWEFEKVMTVQHADEELGTWDFDMTSLEAARERFCAKRDEIVGDVPTEAPATTAAEEEEAMEQQAYLLRAAAMEEADNARRAMIRGHDGRCPEAEEADIEEAAQMLKDWEEDVDAEDAELQLAMEVSASEDREQSGRAAGEGSSAEHEQQGSSAMQPAWAGAAGKQPVAGALEAEFEQDSRITRGDGEHSSGGRTPTAPAESSARKAARSSLVLPPSVQPSSPLVPPSSPSRSSGLSPARRKAVGAFELNAFERAYGGRSRGTRLLGDDVLHVDRE